VRGRLDALGPGRPLLGFLPVLAVIAAFAAAGGEWGVVAACALVALILVAWFAALRGRADSPRLWPASLLALGVFAYAAMALDGNDYGALLPFALFAAFAVAIALGGPDRR
jgi:hypothetical protein